MKDIVTNLNNNHQGATLLMSLLILSVMMASAVALSRVILGEIRMSNNTKNVMGAFYAADSAVEKGLYYIKYARKYGDGDPLSALAGLGSVSVGSDGQAFSFTEISTSTPGFVFYDISTSTPAHVDILDPAGDISNIDWDDTPDIAGHYYIVDWSIEDCYPFHASDKLEISTYSFANNSGFVPSIDTGIVVCNCSLSSNDQCDSNLTQKAIQDNNFYRFSFRPLNDTVKSINFDVYSDPIDGSPDYTTAISSNTLLEAEGVYKNSKYMLKAEVPSVAIFDIFSYVIFSEEELSKNL